MSRIQSLAVAACLLALSNLALAADNVVSNPSFEEADANGLPLGWGYYLPPVPADDASGLTRGTPGLFSTDGKTTKTGGHSLRISSPVPVRCSLSQYLPFQEGQSLRVSAWIKGKGLGSGPDQGACLRLSFVATAPEATKALSSQQVLLKTTESTFDWTLFSAEVTVPKDVKIMPLECYLWKSAGTVWFDDVSVEVTAGPAPDMTAVGDPANKRFYAEANAKLPPPAPGEKRVVFIGDSIVGNWKLDTSFPGRGFLNRGIGGQQTSQIHARFQEDALALHPAVIWIHAGSNDLAGGLPPEAIVNNVRSMVRLGTQAGAKTLICSLLPSSDYHKDKNPAFERTLKRPLDKIIEINKELKSMCAQENATYLDLFSLLVDSTGHLQADLSDDGLHPNAQGYSVLAPTVLQAIETAEQ